MRTLLALGLLLAALAPLAPATGARSAGGDLPTLEEALELAFEGCTFERSTVLLGKEERKRAEKLAGGKIDSRLLLLFTATHAEGERAGEVAGWAWVDSHVVRTKRETLLVVVNPDHRIRRLEVLAFGEPMEYLARPAWYAQFVGKKLDEKLRVDRDIRGISGATLTARATTDAVRRVLAVHLVAGPGKPAEDE